MNWLPIESAPRGELILYFPPETGRNAKQEMVRVDLFPVCYPRKPTHWMPIPPPPVADEQPPLDARHEIIVEFE